MVPLDRPRAVHDALDLLLLGLHRSRLAFVDSQESSGARREAFVGQLATQHPVVTAAAVPATESSQGGADAAGELLALDPRPDAVLVYNDVMALGAPNGFAAAGVRVPHDVAVIGTDGLRIGAHVTPTSTSMAIDTSGLASAALAAVDALRRESSASPTGSRRYR